MSNFSLGLRSRANLIGVHPDLVRVVQRAIQITHVDFTVVEGIRSQARQKELVRKGASKTMNSRHLTGHAVDLAPYVGGRVRWDWPLFFPLAKAMKQAAEELKINIRWGGSWALLNGGPEPSQAMLSKSFPDGPHFELPR